MSTNLEIEGLTASYHSTSSIIYALNGVSFELLHGEIAGLMGESGSGKSTLLNLISDHQLLPNLKVSGKITLDGHEIRGMANQAPAKIPGKKIGIVHQDNFPMMNLESSVVKQIADRIITMTKLSKEDARSAALDVLKKVDLPDVDLRLDEKAANLSFGSLRLAVFANALASIPELMILDEPFIGMDAIHQSQLIDLVKQKQAENGMTVLIASHDPGVIASIANKVLIFCGGYLVEAGSCLDIFLQPEHPYTLWLLGSQHHINGNHGSRLEKPPGQPQIYTEKPTFCPFVSRCEFATARCKVEIPQMLPVGIEHRAACFVDLKNGRMRA